MTPWDPEKLKSLNWSVTFPELPVSMNKLYSTYRGKRTLTTAGKSFKARCSEAVRQQLLLTPGWDDAWRLFHTFGGDITLNIVLRTDELFNKTWLQHRRKGVLETTNTGPRTPYKPMDITNLIKLLEDSVVQGTLIDDCNHTSVAIHKVPTKPSEKTALTVDYILRYVDTV